MNYRNRIANGHHEDDGRRSSKDWLGRISSRAQKAKRLTNRRAKRVENRLAFKDQEI